jgi:hypothetical protein
VPPPKREMRKGVLVIIIGEKRPALNAQARRCCHARLISGQSRWRFFSILLTSRVNDNSRFFWRARESRIASARSVGTAQACRYGEVLERYGNWNSIGVSHVRASVILSPARWSRAHHLSRSLAAWVSSTTALSPHDMSRPRLGIQVTAPTCSRRLGHMISFIFPAVIE